MGNGRLGGEGFGKLLAEAGVGNVSHTREQWNARERVAGETKTTGEASRGNIGMNVTIKWAHR